MTKDIEATMISLLLHGLLVGALLASPGFAEVEKTVLELDFSLSEPAAVAPEPPPPVITKPTQRRAVMMPQPPPPKLGTPAPTPLPARVEPPPAVPPTPVLAAAILTQPAQPEAPPLPQVAVQEASKATTEPSPTPVVSATSSFNNRPNSPIEGVVRAKAAESLPVASARDFSPPPGPVATSGNGNSLQGYLARVRASIEKQKRYPVWARSRRLEGKVGLRFLLSPAGAVHDLAIAISSGAECLDRAALQAVRDAAPLPPPDSGLLTGPTPLEITVVFKLT